MSNRHREPLQSRAAGEAIQLPAPIKQPAVSIMASRRDGTLYTGVTSNLVQRAHQHREGPIPGFTARYGRKLLVSHEQERAILREKPIKGGSRAAKLALIEDSVRTGVTFMRR